jgi:parvulin-like peptidyl-prolyl isomerase
MYLRCFMLLAACAAGAAAADIRVLEEIVAKVNGDIVTKGEIAHGQEVMAAQLKQQGLTGAKLQGELDERAKDALRDQIDQLLLVQKAKDLNINVDPDVTRRLAQIQVSQKISDPDKFQAFIREQTGMAFEDFKLEMKNNLLTSRVIGQEITSRISVPEPEKRKYYEEHKNEFMREELLFLRQIFISTKDKTPAQEAAAEQKAKELSARGKRGEKFPELARDNSDDTETAKNGGELPPYKRGDLRKEIIDAVDLFQQRKGFVTDAIKIPEGFVILKVEERWEKGLASYEEVEQEIMERIASPKVEPKVREYLTMLRQEAFLEIRPGFVDTGAAPGKDTSWKDPAQLKPETTTKEEVASRHKRKLLWLFPVGVRIEDDGVEPAQPAAAAPATPAAAPAATAPAAPAQAPAAAPGVAPRP